MQSVLVIHVLEYNKVQWVWNQRNKKNKKKHDQPMTAEHGQERGKKNISKDGLKVVQR